MSRAASVSCTTSARPPRKGGRAVHEFDKASEIVEWLTEQWGGLFQKMLSDRSEAKRLSSLELQVRELENIATTMKRYLEEIVGGSVAGRGEAIIAEERERLKEQRIENEIKSIEFYRITLYLEISPKDVRNIFVQAKRIDDFARQVKEAAGDEVPMTSDALIEFWRDRPDTVEEMNKIRSILGREPLAFESTGKG